jgi:hypothetical protein
VDDHVVEERRDQLRALPSNCGRMPSETLR